MESTQLDGEAVADHAPIDERARTIPRPDPLSFTRGNNARAAMSWVRHHHGDAGVRAVIDAVPADVAVDLGENLKPGSWAWIPTLAHARLMVTIDEVFGTGDLALLRGVGRFMAHNDFPAIAKPVARLLSPGLFVDMSVRIWRLYNSHGTWELLRSPRGLQASLFGAPEPHPAFCMGTLGWIDGALEFCGASDIVGVEERCAARGDPCCSIRYAWTERGDANRRPRPPT